jgi:hypothetical protein
MPHPPAESENRSPKRSGRDRVRQWLGHPLALAFSVLASAVLAAGTLDDGLTFDDRVHRAIVHRASSLLHGGPFDLFRTATGDPAQVGPLVDSGAFPWFTQPELKVAFWRPIASAWHAVDYSLWPNAAWFMHAENLLIYATLVALVGLFLRRIMSCDWAAGAAAFLFAVDETHAGAVGWIAARNGLLAATFALATLLLHHASTTASTKARTPSRQVLMNVGAAASFAAALLSSELAVGVLGYLFAYALFLDHRLPRPRLASVLPYVAVAAVWVIAYRLLGYGVSGSGYYVDPMTDPFAFAFALTHNGPSLLVLTLGLPATIVTWMGNMLWTQRIVPVLSVLLFVGVMVPVLWRDRVARFFALGLLLSLACVCGTLPQGRLLLLVSVGAVGLIARLAVVLSTSDRGSRKWRVGAWVLMTLMVLAHAVIAPLVFPREASAKAREAKANQGAIRGARVHGTWGGRTLVLVRAPHAFSAAEFLFDPDDPSRAPSRVRALHMGPGPVVLSRSGPDLLSVHDSGGMLREPVSWLFHGLQHPFSPGTRIALDAVAFEVVAVTPGGRPTTVLCRFDRPLEDSESVWLIWRAGRYLPFEPPKVGERVVVP